MARKAKICVEAFSGFVDVSLFKSYSLGIACGQNWRRFNVNIQVMNKTSKLMLTSDAHALM